MVLVEMPKSKQKKNPCVKFSAKEKGKKKIP